MLIDRKNDYYVINNLSLELVVDALPSGEQRRTFFVFDCLAVHGKSLLQRTLDIRLGNFYRHVFGPYKALLDKYPEEQDNQPFVILPKQISKAYGLEMMFK